MRSKLAFGAAAGAGAAVAFLADPVNGARRRAFVRDKMTRARSASAGAADATAKDARNRARGVLGRAWSRVKPDRADDRVIAARVRTAIGPVVTHPGALDVRVSNGIATLSGPVLAREVDDVLRAARRARGVRTVENRLDVHETAGNIPALQGEGTRRRVPGRWSPTARLLCGAAASGLVAAGARRGGAIGRAMAVAGGAAAARALLNQPAKRLVGVRAGRRAVDVQKSITIAAPATTVYSFWRDVEYLPLFMRHVREVRPNADGSYHWIVDGPAKTTVEWDAEITDEEPNRLLAWRTRPGFPIQHAGIVRFVDRDGSTDVHVRMSYNPVAGRIGHAAATLLGVDPKKQMDDDLMRLKHAVETGKQPHDAAAGRM